jgi:hypothetical protein
MSQQSSQPIDEDFEEDFVLNPQQPLALLLGWIDHEGIRSSLKSANRQYKKKILESLPSNWESIVEIFDSYSVSCSLGKINSQVIKLLAHESYAGVRDHLFSKISGVPNQFFIYEGILLGEPQDAFSAEFIPYPKKEVVDEVISWLREKNITVIPYRKNADVTVLAEAFLDDTERNLIFRLYVPSGKIWSNEADKFLQLFRDYLNKVDKTSVRLDQRRTDFGVIYEFHGHTPSSGTGLTSEFKEFSHLMDLCAFDVDAAGALLASKNLNQTEITAIVSRYAKEARRLQMDIKHESESKTLSIRHRLEAELLELAPTAEDWVSINSYLNAALPTAPGLLLTNPLAPQRMVEASSITYNIRPQFIQAVNNVTAQEIYGNQHFTAEHHEILKLISEHAAEDREALNAAVYEVADTGTKHIEKLKAKNLLKSFLIETAKKTGDIAIGVLQTYIEKQIGL